MAEVVIRAVDIRTAPLADLTALHAVEIPVQDEVGGDRMPRQHDDYLAFARGLPPQLDDHTWLAEAAGAPVAVGYCWSNAAGDGRVMECDVLVHREWRRRGIGTRLFERIRETTVADGRSLLTWSTVDAVPAGDAFARNVGAEVARSNRTSELALAAVDWPMVESWAAAPEPQRAGYSIETIVGPHPPHLLADAAAFHHIMQTAPQEELDAGTTLITPQHVAEIDRSLVDAGRLRWNMLVRSPDGTCVGGTQVTFEPDEPTLAHQQNTGVHPDHRHRGLARWVKAAMLLRIRDERPATTALRTSNAWSNAPMLAINDALGFHTVSTRTEWQLRLP